MTTIYPAFLSNNTATYCTRTRSYYWLVINKRLMFAECLCAIFLILPPAQHLLRNPRFCTASEDSRPKSQCDTAENSGLDLVLLPSNSSQPSSVSTSVVVLAYFSVVPEKLSIWKVWAFPPPDDVAVLSFRTLYCRRMQLFYRQ